MQDTLYFAIAAKIVSAISITRTKKETMLPGKRNALQQNGTLRAHAFLLLHGRDIYGLR